eukprot:CAMPEP_0174757544 /NCGR_PEP_ID=MMETSP1094-20130205/107303_1 /TAXON_ID=156173 /ORGANISM="Chrysochromulina brevifilum, Strain UTEX LB 985" /LENGTH=202 /DNA_ID=CAMNT_0015963459 /DNA_START=319 /DNA_END=927 /DNA_ORIENTATION=-
MIEELDQQRPCVRLRLLGAQPARRTGACLEELKHAHSTTFANDGYEDQIDILPRQATWRCQVALDQQPSRLQEGHERLCLPPRSWRQISGWHARPPKLLAACRGRRMVHKQPGHPLHQREGRHVVWLRLKLVEASAKRATTVAAASLRLVVLYAVDLSGDPKGVREHWHLYRLVDWRRHAIESIHRVLARFVIGKIDPQPAS